eukprot:7409343-Ditylum_brightwellii.AAC.1
MPYLHNMPSPDNYECSMYELECLTPHGIYCWMACKVYGRDDPLPDDNSTEGCSTSLKYHKKATSYYIPNCRVQWNKISKVRNPTRSDNINGLIQVVIRKEVCKQGKPSRADCGFKQPEMG